MERNRVNTKYVTIEGRVQGVGFRPFIYKYAILNNIKGNVINNTDGVSIIAQSNQDDFENFLSDIRKHAPRASQIDNISVSESNRHQIKAEIYKDFKIEKSKSQNSINNITEVSPDISVCESCLEDMKTQKNRINYSFTNCTDCGPRFSIIKDLPYDREKTTMAKFKMCKDCESEYIDVMDRRFHAQPVACSNCGPHYQTIYKNTKITDINKILDLCVEELNNSNVITLKGMGGYHLICDANNSEAVEKIRFKKNREAKPFAVMFKDLEVLKEYVHLNKYEEKIVNSWQKPITLLKEKKSLSTYVNNGFNKTGAILPYMPFHYLLFEKCKMNALVFTSANISDEPVIIDDNQAIETFNDISDLIITYNREIFNRNDDSLVQIINNKINMVRRSRSFAPSPIRIKLNTNNIIACGAELVNTFAIGRGNQIILSQHIGDLKNHETLNFFEESLSRFSNLFQLKPELIAHDLHPDYLSSKYALDSGIKTIAIQHHHAHIASCMAENNLDEKVIGISFDGTGLGDDNNIWGGEFFICDLNEYKRVNHFEYIPIPGGDVATKQSWRTAVSYLYNSFGNEFKNLNLEFLKTIDSEKIEFIIQMIDKKINSPLSSSSGRLFDAVSALINICPIAEFHAEAPMRLENLISRNVEDAYSYEISESISFKSTIREIVEDLKSNINTSIISAKFHNTIVNLIVEECINLRDKYKINKVVLSGGSFQNIYLSENAINKLSEKKFTVFSHSDFPANDGGLSLGQIAIAAKRRELKLI